MFIGLILKQPFEKFQNWNFMTRNLSFAISAVRWLIIMSFNYLIRQQSYYCTVFITFSSGALSLRERPHSPVSSLCKNCNVMKSLKSIYFSPIDSHIAYGIVIYGSTRTTTITLNQIFLLKKKLVQIMLKLNEEFVKSYYGLFKILSVDSQYIYIYIV